MAIKVKLLAHTPNPDAVVAAAAKLCYSKEGVEQISEKLTDEEVKRFVNHLVEMGHESPIEHVAFTFGIEGISRSCSHQIVRHRIASYSQQSQRYVKLDQFEYIIPPEIEKDSYARTIFIKHMEDSQKAYDELVDVLIENKLDKKYPTWIEDTEDEYMSLSSEEQLQLNQNIRNLWAKNHKKEYSAMEKEAIEDARYVFPNACETKMVVTMNARSLYNFFSERCCNRAQWEIRELADLMLKECEKVAPILFSNCGAPCATTGKCPEGKMSCGEPKTKKK